MDPGGEAADECLAKVQAMAAGRRRLVHSVDPAHAAERRRAQPLFDPKQRATRIDQAFVAQGICALRHARRRQPLPAACSGDSEVVVVAAGVGRLCVLG